MVPEEAYSVLSLSSIFTINLYGSRGAITSVQYDIPQPGSGFATWDLLASPARLTLSINGSIIYPPQDVIVSANSQPMSEQILPSSRALLPGDCLTNEDCHLYCDTVSSGIASVCLSIDAVAAIIPKRARLIFKYGAGGLCAFVSLRASTKCSKACDSGTQECHTCSDVGMPCGNKCCNTPPVTCYYGICR